MVEPNLDRFSVGIQDRQEVEVESEECIQCGDDVDEDGWILDDEVYCIAECVAEALGAELKEVS
jgi:hypothetical protein